MADQKISALTASTTPLVGTEVLPIVQSGTTKQVSVANLTAGRAVSMSTMTATGNTASVGGPASAWNSLFNALELAGNGAIMGVDSLNLFNNAFYNGSDYIYKTTAAATRLLTSGGEWNFYRAPSGTAGTAIVFGTPKMTLDASDNLTIAGTTATKASGTTWSNPSDVRLKDNIRDYAKGIAELMQIQVREWEYNGKGGTQAGLKGLGVVADEAMLVLPDTVSTYEAKLESDDKEVTAIKKFDATEITWLLVSTVQEQQTLIRNLTARLDALEGST